MDIQTLYSKIASIPTSITSWLGSDVVIDTTEKMESLYTLPKGSTGTIAKLIQRIQIKDLAPDYFSGELATELQLDRDKATHITSEIKKNIFAPIRKNFADYGIDIDLLDKFQMPVTKPSPVPAKTFQNINIELMQGRELIAPSPSRPSILSDIGWSRASSTGPGIQLNAVPPASPAPTATPPKTLTPVAATPSMPPPPVPAPKPSEPAPVMLHEDTTFKAAEKNAGFTLSRPGSGAEMYMDQNNTPAPVRPAVLEFGGMPASNSKPLPSAASSISTSSEFKLSLSSVPTVSGGSRSVNQIVPPPPVPVPMPPKPPTPPTPPVPQPPKPPLPQNNKPIVKDFL
jgi:hypothetical protein